MTELGKDIDGKPIYAGCRAVFLGHCENPRAPKAGIEFVVVGPSEPRWSDSAPGVRTSIPDQMGSVFNCVCRALRVIDGPLEEEVASESEAVPA